MERSGNKRDNKGRFIKGSTGNKGGRPKVVSAILEMAQQNGLEAFQRVIELTQSKDERIALAACKEVLDRAYGRPEQAHKLEGEGLGKTVIVIKEKDGHD